MMMMMFPALMVFLWLLRKGDDALNHGCVGHHEFLDSRWSYEISGFYAMLNLLTTVLCCFVIDEEKQFPWKGAWEDGSTTPYYRCFLFTGPCQYQKHCLRVSSFPSGCLTCTAPF